MLFLFGPAVQASMATALLAVFLLGLLPSVLVPMLQTRLMDVAHEGQALAAALNHSTLNLANALGAWLGSIVLSAGLGYEWPSRVGGFLAVAGIGDRALVGAPAAFDPTRSSSPACSAGRRGWNTLTSTPWLGSRGPASTSSSTTRSRCCDEGGRLGPGQPDPPQVRSGSVGEASISSATACSSAAVWPDPAADRRAQPSRRAHEVLLGAAAHLTPRARAAPARRRSSTARWWATLPLLVASGLGQLADGRTLGPEGEEDAGCAAGGASALSCRGSVVVEHLRGRSVGVHGRKRQEFLTLCQRTASTLVP